VKAAIAAGKHVYCEWPLAANTAQATELAVLANEASVQHVVGLQGRKSPIVNYVRDLVAKGFVGQVLSVSMSVASPGRSGSAVAPDRVWAMDKANGATTFSIIGGHNIDILRYCVGEPSELNAVVAVRYPDATVADTGAALKVTSPDVVLVHGLLASGGFVTINVQAGLPKGTGALLEIQGSDGMLSISGPGSLHLSDNSMTLRGSSGETPLAELDVPDSYRVVPDVVPVGTARNIAGLYLALANALEGGEPIDPSFDTAVSLHRLLDAMEQSSDTGRRTVLTS
jgi:predicted dehydrogenase